MLRKKSFWIVTVVVLLVAAGGYAAYRRWLAPAQAAEAEPTVETATVTVGDLSITAAGSGTLLPSREAALSFSTSGTVLEVLVEVGDRVAEGDLLARIDDAAARQAVADAELAVISAEQALAVAVEEAELAVARAEADLVSAEEALDALANWEPDEEEVKVAKANLVSAQVSYQNAVAKAGMVDQQNASVRIKLTSAIEALASAQEAYDSAMNPERDWERNIDTTRENAAAALVSAQRNLELAQADYDLAMVDGSAASVQSAYAAMVNAQTALDALTSPPDESEIRAAELEVQELKLALRRAQLALGEGSDTAHREAELALEQAQLKLAAAEADLAGTTLRAPFAGTVTEVNVQTGETPSGTAITLANLHEPVVQFWVEEADVSSVAAGYPVNFTFEALPDTVYAGTIYRVDPVLVSVANVPAVQCWATIDTAASPMNLLGEMNVEVEIVAGQATNALLVPVQALRELGVDAGGETQYAVFVVQDNGELELRQVEVGLQDFVNAEILSGLAQGETVTLAQATTSTSSASSSSNPFEGQVPEMGGLPGFLGGGGRQ